LDRNPGALMVDCYDINGVISTRDEYFFPNRIDDDCTSVSLENIVGNLTGWIIPANLTNATGETLIKECDFYEYGTGYIYSTLDNGIGPVILSSL
jgi:hypothetical protein